MNNTEKILLKIKNPILYKSGRTKIAFLILLVFLMGIIYILYQYSPYKIFFEKVSDIFIGIAGAIFAFAINYLSALFLHKFKKTQKNSIEVVKRYFPKLWIISLYLFVVVLEEIICRSYLLSYIESISNIYFAILGNSLVFVLFHWKYKVLQIFILGVIFSILTIISGNLLVPILAHFLNNLIVLYYKK